MGQRRYAETQAMIPPPTNRSLVRHPLFPLLEGRSGQLVISHDFASDFQVSSSQMDVNSGGVQAAFLGNVGDGPFLNFTTSGTVGSAAQAQTNISTVGAHHLVGVLDFSNN